MKTLIRALNVFVVAVLALILTANLYSIVAKSVFGVKHPEFFGWSTAVVMSGSMEGTEKDSLSVNDMVIIHRQKDYNIGDVITFHSTNSLVTHRIMGETEKGFVTRGDNNNTNDKDPVSKESIVGRVIFSIPKMGLVIGYLRTPLGMISMILIGALLIVFPSLWERWEQEKNEKGGTGHAEQTEAEASEET